MHYTITINKISSLEEIKGYWTNKDFINLLDKFDVPDGDQLDPSELWEMLCMAVSDFEPDEAAAIILDYKLGEELNEGQIQNISHEMLEDKISEEYPNIALHYPLFNINQLLYKAYNGKFPKILATQLEVELSVKGEEDLEVSKEMMLKYVEPLLSDRNPIKRLFEDQLEEGHTFEDAKHVIWELHNLGQHQYRIITSDYWINREDIVDGEFSI
jgi:hypothetical protein